MRPAAGDQLCDQPSAGGADDGRALEPNRIQEVQDIRRELTRRVAIRFVRVPVTTQGRGVAVERRREVLENELEVPPGLDIAVHKDNGDASGIAGLGEGK